MPLGDGTGPFGQGPGAGRRGGFGRGRGGRRMFTGRPPSPNPSGQDSPQPLSNEQELEMLKKRSQVLKQQLDVISKRIDELSQKGSQESQESTVAARVKAFINETECTGCGICANVCPEGAIRLNDIAKVDGLKCTGCGICVRECPNQAISLRKI